VGQQSKRQAVISLIDDWKRGLLFCYPFITRRRGEKRVDA